MNRLNKLIIFLFSFISIFFLSQSQALAICPVCVVTVTAGVGLSRWLGIDDTVTGLWLGGVMVSMILWTLTWPKITKINLKYKEILLAVAYYLFVIGPLGWFEVVGHPQNRIWGVDKLILGVILGSLGSYLGVLSYQWLKKKNNDKAHFPFQKVFMPVVPIIVLSVIFYYLTRSLH